MSTRLLLSALCALGLLVTPVLGQEADDAQGEGETRKIEAGDITIEVPKAWKEKAPTRFRLVQFDVPAAESQKDKREGTEYVVYYFGGSGGGVEANVNRWINQFQPEGRKAKATRGTSPQGEYVLVDVTGTYKKPIGPPIRQQFKELPGARMLAVILSVKPNDNYFLKMAGPKETVTAAADVFRASFGGDARQEKEYKAAEEE